MKKRVVCKTVSETEDLGCEIAGFAEQHGIKFIALYGGLGAGKTAFVRGFARRYGLEDKVASPTYNLVNIYGCIYHFDMYRIKDEDDLYSIGFYDYDDGQNIIITEWSENIEYALPDAYIKVSLNKSDDLPDVREILVETVGI